MKEKPYNGGQWTEARFRSFIKSALRQASMRWGPMREAISDRFVERGPNPGTGRMCKLHKCDLCGKLFPQGGVRADHIQPVIDVKLGFVSWDEVVKRLFVEKDGYQVLCKECHDIKTSRERELRKEYKKDSVASSNVH